MTLPSRTTEALLEAWTKLVLQGPNWYDPQCFCEDSEGNPVPPYDPRLSRFNLYGAVMSSHPDPKAKEEASRILHAVYDKPDKAHAYHMQPLFKWAPNCSYREAVSYLEKAVLLSADEDERPVEAYDRVIPYEHSDGNPHSTVIPPALRTDSQGKVSIPHV